MTRYSYSSCGAAASSHGADIGNVVDVAAAAAVQDSDEIRYGSLTIVFAGYLTGDGSEGFGY